MSIMYFFRETKPTLDMDLAEDEEREFAPDLLNSTVYIISMALQISTFAINYRVSLMISSFHSFPTMIQFVWFPCTNVKW